MNQRIVISGGQGELAGFVQQAFTDAGDHVLAPGREHCDVCNEESVTSYFDSLERVDLLICNAGVGQESLLLKTLPQQANHIIDTNLRGSFFCARAAAKSMMKKRQGHIVFISSYLSVKARPGQAMYSASKAAINGLTKSLAAELGSRNIRVNAVMPGFLETKMTAKLSGEVKESIRKEHKLGRFNTSEAVADFLVCLHHNMPHTSGQIFSLDSRPLL